MIGRRSVGVVVLVAGCGVAPGPTGDGFTSLATGLQGVAALAWDPVRAELVVAEADGDRLLRWTPQGAEAFQERAQRPLALAFDDDGRLLVIEGRSRSLVRYDRDGERSVLATGFATRRFEAPVALAAGPDREVWVLDGGERAGLYRLAWDSPAPDAKRVVTRVPARFETPRAVAFAGAPPQVVVCAGPDPVDMLRARWAAAGELEELRRGVRIEGLQITALVGGRDGSLLIGGNDAADNGLIQVWSVDGSLVRTFAAPGPVAALCMGGADGRRLFVAGRTTLHAVDFDWPGR